MIVIPMAGLSRRFTEAGYALPKYRLDLHGQSLFARTVSSFSHYFSSERFLFIARGEKDTIDFIAQECGRLGVADMETVILDAPTKGQAETVELGLSMASAPPDQALTIFNIDTIRPNFRYPAKPWLDVADGYLEVMPADDPGYSYAKADPAGDDRVSETAEKRVISNLASTGLYYFKNAALFRDAYARECRAPSAPELYVAPLYNHLIGSGRDVRYELIPEADVIFCGTPDQYRQLEGRPELFRDM